MRDLSLVWMAPEGVTGKGDHMYGDGLTTVQRTWTPLKLSMFKAMNQELRKGLPPICPKIRLDQIAELAHTLTDKAIGIFADDYDI